MSSETGESEQIQRAPDEDGGQKQVKKTAPRAVGRVLGKALVRAKRTKVWQDTARSYREGIEGDK